MPKLDGILETAIHTEDMVRARAFYEGVLGLEPIYSNNRLSAYAVAGRDVLLVFRKCTTEQTVALPSGTIPGHGGDGDASRGVAIEGRNNWERGGRRIYFRDPDGHLWNSRRRDCGRCIRHYKLLPGRALRQFRKAHDLIHRGSQA